MSDWQPMESAPVDGTVIWLRNEQMIDPLLGHWGERFHEGVRVEKLGWVSDWTHQGILPVRAGIWIFPTQWREASPEETS